MIEGLHHQSICDRVLAEKLREESDFIKEEADSIKSKTEGSKTRDSKTEYY